MPLADKIRYSYFMILVPMLFFMILCIYNIWGVNIMYGELVDAAGIASDFSLDFKKDFDYETYLIIVENKTLGESELDNLLSEANRIVGSLEEITGEYDLNESRLNSVKKYLKNLATYKSRIEDNLRIGNRYEENIEIWENDVQIVTALVRESMLQYIYYEIQDMQTTRVEYRDSYTRLLLIMLSACAVMLAAIMVLSYYIPLSITKPIRQISDITNQVANGDLTVRAQTDYGAEVGVLSESLNSMIDKINMLLEQVTQEQIHLRKAELELLQSQINPHFLYNTLDTIVWLEEGGDRKQVVEMVRSLSEFFRTALNQGKEVVSLREELQHVGSYLKIQHVRYRDILEYEINVSETLNTCQIPKITVQPIVENALYHGIKNKRGKGMISITGEICDNDVILRVKDNGIGMEPDQLERIRKAMLGASGGEPEGYGLYNVNERIRLKFGEAYGLSVDSTYGEGTEVSIRLPYTESVKI